jgi:tRNA A58 N-methylase Trm61
MGLTDRVTFHRGDPARMGFGCTGLDGLFIDVPEPWTLAGAGWQALAGGAPWVSLSPTVGSADNLVRKAPSPGLAESRRSR